MDIALPNVDVIFHISGLGCKFLLMTEVWVGMVIGVSFYGAMLGVVLIAEDDGEQTIARARRLALYWRRSVEEIRSLLK